MATIRNREDLQRWLNVRPKEKRSLEAAALSLRAAQRVLPFVFRKADDKISDKLLKWLLRVVPASAFVVNWPSFQPEVAPFIFDVELAFSDDPTANTVVTAAIDAIIGAAASAARSADAAYDATDVVNQVVNAAHYAAGAAAFASVSKYVRGAAGAAAIAAYAELWADALVFEAGESVASVLSQPLFTADALRAQMQPRIERFFAALHQEIEGEPVWIDWYEKLLRGHRFSEAEASAYVFLEGADWEKSSLSEINAAIRKKLESLKPPEQDKPQGEQQAEQPIPKMQASQIPDLAELGSPDLTVGSNGKLALRSNPTYDPITLTADGFDLVEAQRAILAVIEASIPTDGPQHLRVAINQYRDALPSNDRQSKAIVLNVIFPVIVREVRDTKDQNWIASGVLVSCKTFQKLHPKLMDFAHNQKEWDKKVAAVPLNEDFANDPRLRNHLLDLDKKLLEAVRVGIAEQPVANLAKDDLAIFDNLPRLTDADRVQPKSTKPSPRKKWLISRLVFWKRLATVTPAAVTVVKDGPDALAKLKSAANAILELLQKFFAP